MRENIKAVLTKFKVYEYYEKYKSLIRFVIVGCINTGVDFLTFTLAHSLLGLDKLICQIAGYSMGVINSFIMNKLWTFEDKKSKSGTGIQFARFVGVNAVSLGVSLLGLELLNGNYGINIYVSKVAVTFVAQVVNYFGYKLLVFNKK